MTRLASLLVLTIATGCFVDNGKQNVQPTPAFYAENVKGYANTAAGLPPEVVYGWNVEIVGEEARWRECTAIDACTNVERKRPVKALVGTQRVGETTVDGKRVDVMKISLEARPAYVVPTTKP